MTSTQEARKSLRELRESTGTLFAKNNTGTKITCNTDTVRFELEPAGYDDSIRIVPKECLNVPGFQRLWMRRAVTISDDEAMENEITLLMGGQVAYAPKVVTVGSDNKPVEVEAKLTEDPHKQDIVFRESGDPTGRNYSIETEHKCLVGGEPVLLNEKQISEGEPPLCEAHTADRSHVVSTPSADGTWTHQLVQIEAPVVAEPVEAPAAEDSAAEPKKAPARRSSRRKTGS